MTRINSAINPKNLMDRHLVAELHELPRVFTSVNKRLEEGKDFYDIPSKFSLGGGHVKFFYNKLLFMEKRFNALRQEYSKRYNKQWGYSIEERVCKDKSLYKDYSPTPAEKRILIERISSRILNSAKQPLYFGKYIDGFSVSINEQKQFFI